LDDVMTLTDPGDAEPTNISDQSPTRE
jgi:hypothetical protein